ncbi:NAD/FAD-utilizing enzyme [Porticoccaceae bacterium LTM1]|nr:NAD/FAD-utilizing enzyme [Porticoccaceae bacterium LTM1]
MKRHYYISDDLDDLDKVEEELEKQGFSTPQIHVLSLDDANVAQHEHLNEVEAVLRKDVVHGTIVGAIIGLILAAVVLIIAHNTGLPEKTTWVPFIFLSIIVLGFCTWEGGLFGIQEPHKQFKRFQKQLKTGQHVFFVDANKEQEEVLQAVVNEHPRLRDAGIGHSRPAIVIWWNGIWKRFIRSMP